MIPNTILVTDGKGGVGKTSLVANIAGLAAASGWHTLAIDLDPQGNLARDLGVLDEADDGTNLHHTITNRAALEPLRDVRPGLDLAPGGPALDNLPADITVQAVLYDDRGDTHARLLDVSATVDFPWTDGTRVLGPAGGLQVECVVTTKLYPSRSPPKVPRGSAGVKSGSDLQRALSGSLHAGG